ncbi:excalibur calcium-binding domain-containing protein [Streptomyces sp. NPDC059639]|uniref:excalibur calcium-binding domain-containing protein n=1 Tax=Streptomyces sp. NPDC059639 TaxID=3346891 RepID=UPI0036B3B261
MGDSQGWGDSWHQPSPPDSPRPRRRLPGPWWLWALAGVFFVLFLIMAGVKSSDDPAPSPTVTVTEPGPTVTETEVETEPADTVTVTEPAEESTAEDEATEEPEPEVSPSTSSYAYYPDCDAARAAGVAPLYRGEPGYSSDLDRDGDGVACEPYP